MNGSIAVVLALLGCMDRAADVAPPATRRTQPVGSPLDQVPPRPPQWPASQPLPVVGGAPIAPAAAPPGGLRTVAPQRTRVNNPRRMRLLVITARETDVPYVAIRSFLHQLGVPFDTLVAATADLTPALLSDGTRGHYQAVILATSNLAYFDGTAWRSAFTDEEWRTLWAYEADFGVRQMTYYSFPGYPDDLGLELVGAQPTDAAPMPARLTTAGRTVFPYLQTEDPATGAAVPFAIRHAYVYLARPRDGSVTPLLTWSGHSLLSVKRYADGRENLTCTFDHNPDLRHSLLLNYGMVSWLTRGLFLGDRRYYLMAHVDDFYLANNVWDPLLDRNGTEEFRMTSDDLDAAIGSQNELDIRHRVVRDFRLDMVFNGFGIERYGERDGLRLHASLQQSEFRWVNHSYSHITLDGVTYAQGRSEVLRNNRTADDQGLNNYDRDAMVTGAFSGLEDPEFMRAAYDTGVRYLAGNASLPGYNNPSPNAGIPSPLQPAVLIVPRRPTNIFYNVTNPTELVDEYNLLFRGTWGRDLSYDEIIDAESEIALLNLLKYNINPLFFHQSNLRRYHDGGRDGALLADFLEALVRKYELVCAAPLENISFKEIGVRMRQRMAYDASGVEGVLDPGARTVTLRVARAARVPLTGVREAYWETYADTPTSYFDIGAGETVTVRMP